MSQSNRIWGQNTNRTFIASAALLVAAANLHAQTVHVLHTRTDTLNHEQTTSSAFFTSNADGTIPFGADGGWAPKNPTKAGEVASTTPTKTYNIVGNSTAANNWTDGNGVPAGVTLGFTAEFTITALPTATSSFLTNPGLSGGQLGNGIGISQTLGAIDTMGVGEGIQVSAVTLSNINFTGTLADTSFTFTPGGVSNFGTRVFRSNSFNETTGAMLLTQGTDTIGFGTATGSVASNLIINNNFGTSGGANPASSIFDRRLGPYALEVTAGTSVIKGIGITYDISYDITPAPISLAGDYNGNGVVDGADYILWRKGDLAADSNGDQLVDQIDYDAWRANYGSGNGPGLGVSSAVPEPTSAMLLVLGSIAAPMFATTRRAR